MPPLFVFTDTFDTTIPIGDRGLPIHVTRLSKADLDVLDTAWNTLMVEPRGADVDLDAWNASLQIERLKFFDQTIREYITLDEGLMTDRGKPVTDGAGLIGVFHGRKDVLGALVGAVIAQNHLVELFRKNSSSPRTSGPGSRLRIPPRGGDAPASTVAPVDDSTTADPAAVTDDPDGDPSGVKVH